MNPLFDDASTLMAVLEHMPDGVLLVAPHGSIALMNRAAEALLGYDRSELLGHSVEVLIPARYRGTHLAARDQYTQDPRIRPMGLGLDLRALAKDGRELPVEISLAPLDLMGERFTIAVVRDVSERRKLEERAQEAARAKEELRQRDEILAVASHELRGPVGLVQLQLRILQKTASETIEDLTTMRERMMKVERNALHLAKLVDTLLDVSQATAEELPLSIEDVDLAAVVRDTVERLHEEVSRSGSTVDLNLAEPTLGRWDKIRLEEVVGNLLVNAVKFGRGQPITVTVEAHGPSARLSVTDRGVGIAAEDQQRIFQRFERLVAPGMTPGLGLGLYIVRRIVEAHGGRVLVRSALGEGSTFTVELPRTAQITPRREGGRS